MKTVLTLLATLSLSHAASAGTLISCKSANYGIGITLNAAAKIVGAEYSVNGIANEGADVSIDKSYVSKNAITASLTVDGKAARYELAITRAKDGKFSGKIYSGKLFQNATCMSEYAVTAEDRDDETDPDGVQNPDSNKPSHRIGN